MKLLSDNPVLRFTPELSNLRDSLSAVVLGDNNLWVASDESTSIERLSSDDGITFKHHKSFTLDSLLELPAAETSFEQELDIEGLDISDSYLWLIGSHSIKRKRVDGDATENEEKLIKRLAKTEADGNRFVLARVPINGNRWRIGLPLQSN